MTEGNGGQGNPVGTVTFAEFFSGIGAMRLGFEQACRDLGLAPNCVHACEIDEAAVKTYRAHFKDAFDPLGDITKLGDAKEAIPKCDIILAGFPCPDFSAAGKHLGLDGDRGKLFFVLAKTISEIKPRAFLLENVKGLANHNGGKTLRIVLDSLRGLGYSVHYAILNSRDFGVPQNRPRIYIVGFLDGGKGFRFPEPTDSTKRLKDVLEAEPVHPRHYLTEQYVAGIRRHKARHEAKGNGFGYRILDQEADVSSTLVCGGMGRERNLIVDHRRTEFPILPRRKSPISKECIRRLTPLECERLQGLPTHWTAGQADGRRYIQLGNAVTVPVIRAISRNLLEALGRAGPDARPTIIVPNRAGDASPVSLPLTTVDICAGCGGLSQGLTSAEGIDVKVACEFDPAAAETYRLNHPGTIVIQKDLTTEEAKRDIVAALGGRRCDLLVGGVPCQSYSISGRRDPLDPRGSLFEHFIEMVRRLAPRVACIENVPGILSMKGSDGTPVTVAIARAFKELGYSVGYRLLNAADFGDPQVRLRVVIFAWRQGGIPKCDKTHFEHGRGGLPRWRTVRDTIGDLEGAPEDKDFWHIFTVHDPDFKKRMQQTPFGGNCGGLFGDGYRRDWPDRPSSIIKTVAWPIHYAHPRTLTCREAARLQSFPDAFRFVGNGTDVATMIGNAVPCGLARAIGKAVIGMLRPALPPPKDPFVNACPLVVKGGHT